jgi:two-component system chemotaxis sensor kinase CheA
VRFEKEPNDTKSLDTIFRLVHTIKGTCGFLGLPRLAALTHAAETLLGGFRNGSAVTVEAVNLILASIDRIKALLDALERNGIEPDGNDRDLIGELEALDKDCENPLPAPERDVTPSNQRSRASAHDRERTERASGSGEPRGSVVPDDSEPSSARKESAGTDKKASIRVQVSTLDRLMTVVSELVLTRNQLIEIGRRRADNEFKTPLQRLSNITAELQEGVLQTRMQPIAIAWKKLPRLVRDLATELRKSIELEMHGAETELDRHVLELISRTRSRTWSAMRPITVWKRRPTVSRMENRRVAPFACAPASREDTSSSMSPMMAAGSTWSGSGPERCTLGSPPKPRSRG